MPKEETVPEQEEPIIQLSKFTIEELAAEIINRDAPVMMSYIQDAKCGVFMQGGDDALVLMHQALTEYLRQVGEERRAASPSVPRLFLPPGLRN